MLLEDTVQRCIQSSLQVIRLYDWLLDLYVLDFFVDNHWEKLPLNWQKCFQDLDPQILGMILAGKQPNHVFPLSFLALLASVKVYSLPRQCGHKFSSATVQQSPVSCGGHPKLKNLFLKHVKLKKRHEIGLMAKTVNDTATQCECNAVVDFGSGLGHLVRVLSYKYDLYTAGIECQNQLTEEASKLDLELEYTASKHLSPTTIKKLHRPTHSNITLSSQNQILNLPFPDEVKSYGLVGLHPCGDLGPLLLRQFVTNEKVKFICVVGCCYMKLSCGEGGGYPMSAFVKGLNSGLSFTSREISCHAIENYCDRLQKGLYQDLKIHAFRAALERILLEHDPKRKHAPVRSVKHSDAMTFENYCSLALQRIKVSLCAGAVPRGARDVAQWRRVVTVYSLRLALAPLVETAVLLDRVLYVLEHGFSCEIHPVFDPEISPRNHIIIAKR